MRPFGGTCRGRARHRRIRSVHDVRHFVWFVGGYSLSAYGTYLNLIALSLFTWHVTGSAVGTGAVMALRLASGFLGGLTADRVNRRFSRRTVMIGADIAQASAMVALVVAPSVPVLCAVAVVTGAGNTLFTVALRSSVPELVGQSERKRANGYLVTGRSLGTVLGFASAGVIIPAFGYGAVFAVNAASFLVSAATVCLLPSVTRASEASAAAPVRGVSVLRSLPFVLVGMILVRGADALGSASHNVALPIFASAVGSAGFMSQFMTAWAVGTLLAHPVVSRCLASRALGERAFAVGTCLMSVSFVVAFTGLPAVLLVAVAFVAGFADGFTEISYVTRLQALPDARRDQVFGLSASVETAGLASGMLVAAVLLEALPPLAVVGLFHGVAFTGAAIFLLVLALRRQHRGEHDHGGPSAGVELRRKAGAGR